MPLFSTSPSGTFGLYSGSKLLGERRVAENGGTWSVLRTVVMFHPKGESVFSRTSFVDVMLDLSRELDTARVGWIARRRSSASPGGAYRDSGSGDAWSGCPSTGGDRV